jgi:hypothetical protein
VTVADNGNNRSTLTFICDPANVPDFATAQTARLSIIGALNGVTQSVIVGTSLKETQYEDAIVYPASGVENEDKASITYQILGQNKTGNLKIPAPDPTLFVSLTGNAANIIDNQDALLTTYLGNFQASGYFTISDGEKVAANPAPNGILRGKRTSAKNNNG